MTGQATIRSNLMVLGWGYVMGGRVGAWMPATQPRDPVAARAV